MNQEFNQDLSKQWSRLQRKDFEKKKSLHKWLLLGLNKVSFSKSLSSPLLPELLPSELFHLSSLSVCVGIMGIIFTFILSYENWFICSQCIGRGKVLDCHSAKAA